MKMKQPPKFAKDFWRQFRSHVAAIAVALQVLVIAIIGTILYVSGLWESQFIVSLLIMSVILVLNAIVFFILQRVISQPLRDLLAAVVHVSGEPTDIPLPNPNDPQYEKSGFKDILQTIYQLASQEEESATVPAVGVEATATATAAPVPAPSNKNLLEQALDETICGFVTLDKNRRVTYANKAAPINIDQDGTSQLALIFNGNDTLEAWLDICDKESVRAEHTWTRVPNKLPDEEGRRLFDVIASYNKGAANEVVLTLVDRTSAYESGEQELDFIAFAAHELRGPITVIRGYLDVLQDELSATLQPDQVELFHRLTISANRLSGYINNILNTSRYDRRHLRVHLVETSLAAVYDTIRDDMAMRASAQGRLLVVTIANDLPHIAADPASLGEVLGNLIDNAIKYSNEGGTIEVASAVRGDFVEIAVTDHGIGMPGNVVSNLFQKFYRSHRSRETVSGTGIGLYISKAIVESHGGSISVRSEEGKGSTFTVAIPTYQSVADKLKAGDNSNEAFIEQSGGWIKNHSMYRG